MPKETAKRLLTIIKLKGSGRAETVEETRKGVESFYLHFRSIKDIAVEEFFIGPIPAFRISTPGVLKDRTILFFTVVVLWSAPLRTISTYAGNSHFLQGAPF